MLKNTIFIRTTPNFPYACIMVPKLYDIIDQLKEHNDITNELSRT